MSTNETQGQPKVDPATIAQDFQSAMQGKLKDEQIAAATDVIKATATGYGANGNVASFVFYLQFQVNINGGKSFNGKAGGLTTPGGGALFGTVYTDDLNRLYSDTVSFQFTAVASVYLSIVFFDEHSNALGTFQAGGISTVNGIGGGSGHWS
jgi:hypothetical protein